MTELSEKFLPAKVVGRRPIAGDLFVMKVDPGGAYTYVAGQYATLGVLLGEGKLERAYSILSYIRTLYQDWKKGDAGMPGDHRLFCIQGASHSHEFGYMDELGKYAEEVPWLKYVPTVSRPWDDTEWKGERGRVDELIRKYVEIWGLKPEDTTGYLCGHPGLVEHGRGILQRAGWPKDGMRDEVYFIPGKEGG